MSQRLIRPGLSALVHPRTGIPVTPIGYRRNGAPIWPVIGGAPDDDDDSGGDDTPLDPEDDDDDDDDEDEDEDDKKSKKKGKHTKDDEEDDEPTYTQAEYDKIKTRMKAADKRSSDLETRLKAIENKDKKPEDLASEELATAKAEREKLADERKELRIQNAFLRSNTVDWVDSDDALSLAQRQGILDDVMDENGTVDRKALARALKDLAKRKPHLVAKKASGPDDDNADNDGDDQGSTRTGPRMNGKRKGSSGTVDKAALASKFPALRRR